MKMPQYDGLDAPEAFLEFSLETLHNALTPRGLAESEKSFGKLESMLSHEKVQSEVAEKIQRAKTILTEMKAKYGTDTDPFSDDYIKPLTEIRDLLLDSQSRFKENYEEE